MWKLFMKQKCKKIARFLLVFFFPQETPETRPHFDFVHKKQLENFHLKTPIFPTPNTFIPLFTPNSLGSSSDIFLLISS